MKKLLTILFVSLLFISCGDMYPDKTSKRIKVIETVNMGGYHYQIIKVDSVEFIVYNTGGIHQLPKKEKK